MLEDISGEKIVDEFKSNKKMRMITYGVGGVLALILAYFLYVQFVTKPHELKAEDCYWVGLNYINVDSTNLAIEELEAAVTKFDGSPGGEVAQLLLATQLMKTRDFEGALTQLEGCNFYDTYLPGNVVKLMGDCHSDLGDYSKAAELYLDAAEINPNEITTPEFLFSAGLCAEEINNFEKALEIYNRVKNEYPNSSKGLIIDKYIGRVEFKVLK